MPLTPPGDGFMHLSRLDGSGDVRFRYDPTISQHVAVQGAFVHYDGREFPVQYTGQRTEETWNFDFLVNRVKDVTEQYDALRALFDTARGNTFLWRDHDGRVLYVSLLVSDRDLIKPHPLARVKFTLTRVDPPA